MQNARVGADGTQHSTLKERLDEEIIDVKEDLNALDVKVINTYSKFEGHQTDGGTWNNTTTGNFFHIVIDVEGCKSITTSIESSVPVAFLKSYTVVEGRALDYADGTSKQYAGITDKEWTVPDDAKYMIIETTYFGVDYKINKFIIDGYDFAKSVKENILQVKNDSALYRGEVVDSGRTSFAQCTEDGYYNFKSDDLATITDKPTALTISGILIVHKNSGNGIVFQQLLDSSGKEYFRWGTRSFFSTYSPDDVYRNRGTFTGTTLSDFTLEGHIAITTAKAATLSDCPSVSGGVLENIKGFSAVVSMQRYTDVNGNVFQRYIKGDGTPSTWIQISKPISQADDRIKWLALGDSITQGYYSFEAGTGDETTSSIAVTQNCWARYVADINNYELTNSGVGGSGYLRPGTVLDQLNAAQHIQNIDFTQYDLITLSWGINDWKGSGRHDDIATKGWQLGSADDAPSSEGMFTQAEGATTCSNLKYIIEKIRTVNPKAKLIFISSINAAMFGDRNSRWALNTRNVVNKTFEDFVQAEKTICEQYGIEFIDYTHNSIFDIIACPDLQPDGVHPSLEAHKLMGLELAGKIKYGC